MHLRFHRSWFKNQTLKKWHYLISTGFLHEQNRADRDEYVRILYGNIKPETSANFDKAAADETTAFGVTYDTSSVMHYSATAFSANGGKTIIAIVKQYYFMFQKWSIYFIFFKEWWWSQYGPTRWISHERYC